MLEYHKSQLTQIKLLLFMIIIILSIAIIYMNDNNKKNNDTITRLDNNIQDVHNILFDPKQTIITK